MLAETIGSDFASIHPSAAPLLDIDGQALFRVIVLEKLRDVPECFFDANVWNEIVTSARTKQNALELLDAANPQDSTVWWDCALLPVCSDRSHGRIGAELPSDP
jgi:hypothetical protein